MSEPNRESVEAAARNRFEREKHPSNKFSWETLLPIVKKELLDRSRAELTAALPHLLAAKDAEIAELLRIVTMLVEELDDPSRASWVSDSLNAKARAAIHEHNGARLGPLDDGRPNYLGRLIGQARAQAHPELKNCTYPSRVAAQAVRDLINQLADALEPR